MQTIITKNLTEGGERMAKMTLEAARINKHLTQQELAEQMGVSRQTVRKWESGEQKMRPVYLFMFCHLTETTEDDILLPE